MDIKQLTPSQMRMLELMQETEAEKEKRLKEQEERDRKAAEEAKKSPYRQFLQVNQDNYKAEDWLMKTSPAAYRLFRFITQNMDNYNALMCSYRVFEESLGYKQSTIFRAVKLLKEKKFIQTVKSGTNNVYFVNKELYWHSYGTNYARAEFGAKIIVSADEQEANEREKIKLQAKRYKAIEVEGVKQDGRNEQAGNTNTDNHSA